MGIGPLTVGSVLSCAPASCHRIFDGFTAVHESGPGPGLPTLAAAQVVGYLGYTGGHGNAPAMAALDPEQKFCSGESSSELTAHALWFLQSSIHILSHQAFSPNASSCSSTAVAVRAPAQGKSRTRMSEEIYLSSCRMASLSGHSILIRSPRRCGRVRPPECRGREPVRSCDS